MNNILLKSTLAGAVVVLGFFTLLPDEPGKPEAVAQIETDSHEIEALQSQINLLQNKISNNNTNTTDSESASEDKIGQLTLVVTLLQKQLEKQAKTLDQLENQALASNPPASSNQVVTMTEEEREQQLENQRQHQLSRYQETIALEAEDPAWSIDTVTKTQNALAKVADHLQVDNIECKTSLCQLNISRAGSSTDDEALNAFETSIGWEGEMTLTYNPETGQGTVFMARPGYSLPTEEAGS